jgi:TRAP-type C4-dicarboxylate transport system permease small subunit
MSDVSDLRRWLMFVVGLFTFVGAVFTFIVEIIDWLYDE